MKSTISAKLLLEKGLFPENIPPVFNAKNLWDGLSYSGMQYIVTGKCIGQPALYNASKRGGQRRLFSIPHPAFVRDQALFFERHWSDIAPIVERSVGSVSTPFFRENLARHIRLTPHSELPKLRLQRFSRYKYCLITDVSRFYPSIYTHSIPWAIHGKAMSKADSNPQSKSVFGNRIDFLIRQGQSKQTIGLPVGPDTSKLVSETVMSAVDDAFVKRYKTKKPSFMRHVDDYWIAGNSNEECEKHLQNLRSSLREFELDINEAKTRIVPMRNVFGEKWPYDFIVKIKNSLPPGFLDSDINTIDVLNELVQRAVNDSDDGMIRFAIKKIDENKLWNRGWDMFEHFLAQCSIQFPHSIDYAMRVVAWNCRVSPTSVNRELWIDVARLAALEASKTGRDSEVVWSLWLLKELNEKIPKDISDLIIENCGGLVLAFLVHCAKNRLCVDRKVREKMYAIIDSNPLSGALWPMTLEMIHLKIGKSEWLSGDVPKPLCALHEAGISIIDWSARPSVFDQERDTPMGFDLDPDYAIEDYGSDYSEYDDEGEQDEGDEERRERQVRPDDINVEELRKLL